MTSSGIKLIKRLPKPELIFAGIQQEIVKQLQPVARQHVSERKKIVSDFEHKPDFSSEIKSSAKQVTMSILVTNDSEQVSEDFSIGKLWAALDRTGTRAHQIRPKNDGGRLAFRTGYEPHTRPVGRSGGPGRANGSLVFAGVVNHPGFPPRKFSEVINKRLRRSFEQAIDRGIRIGSKKRR